MFTFYHERWTEWWPKWNCVRRSYRNIWFGTPKSLHVRWEIFQWHGRKFGLCKCDINAILQDKSRNFWFATNQYGVTTFDMMKHLVKNYSKEDGLSFSVQCIFEDAQGSLLFGERAGGVSRYDFLKDKFVKVDGHGCFSNQIMSIMQDNKGMVLVCKFVFRTLSIWCQFRKNGTFNYNWRTLQWYAYLYL